MAVENFTTYTEVDAGSKLTVTATKADASNAAATEYVLLYKDFGAGYFNALDADVTLLITTNSGTNSATGGIMFLNSPANPATTSIQQAASPDICAFTYKYNTAYSIYLFRGNGTALDSYTISANTAYYCTVSHTASSDTVNVYIYNDSGRTTLIDTLTVAGYGTGARWRYVYGFANRKFDEANGQFYGYVENLDLNIATPTVNSGFFGLM